MLFNSWGYLLIYIVLAIPLYWLMPNRARIPFVVVMSIAFYSMWRWEFSLLMIGAAVVDYLVAKRIAEAEDQTKRRWWLYLSLATNLGMLLFFKYTYFFFDNFRAVLAPLGFHLRPLQDMGVEIVLPLGISFFTFQTINYTVDVYRRVIPPAKNFLTFLAYVTFWPHLLAGPILRAAEVLPQLENEREHQFGWKKINDGILLVFSGLFKKVIVADFVAFRADKAFALDPNTLMATDVWVAAFLFGFQIYFDFSGYSDIAIGTARMLGVHLPDNFNWPYVAKSPRDFWKRWHISLSEWIRDYLYLPLTGQKFQKRTHDGLAAAVSDTGSKQRTQALFFTWFIMGLWHGAGWNFVIWGLYHAAFIYLYRRVRFLQSLEDRAPALAWAIMLCISMIGWIPFRAQTVSQTLTMFKILLDPTKYHISQRVLLYHSYTIVPCLILATVAWYAITRSSLWTANTRARIYASAAGVAAMAFMAMIYIRPVRQFIYFQF